jgi:hypothetical protein
MRKIRTLAGAFGFSISVLVSGQAVADTGPGLLKFEVALDNKPIGEHSLTFNRADDGALEIGIAIDLAVKFGPFTVFDYTHRNASLWQDGVLQRMRSQTDDNGDQHDVAIDLTTDRLEITNNGTPVSGAPRAMLPTTYWMASTVAQDRLINSQTGEILEVDIEEAGRETVPGPTGLIEATRYRMTGDLEIELWYDDAGILVGMAFEARGSDVTYRLIERNGLLPVAAAMPNPTARN